MKKLTPYVLSFLLTATTVMAASPFSRIGRYIGDFLGIEFSLPHPYGAERVSIVAFFAQTFSLSSEQPGTLRFVWGVEFGLAKPSYFINTRFFLIVSDAATFCDFVLQEIVNMNVRFVGRVISFSLFMLESWFDNG